MIWFVVGFSAVMVAGIMWSQFAPMKVRLRKRRAAPATAEESEMAVKAAERAVYDARSEEEYRNALRELLEVSSRSLDVSGSAHYVTHEPDNRASG
jgi:hypothetical protein